jgi:polygalacturonase
MLKIIVVISILFAISINADNIIDFEADLGAIPNDDSYDTALFNGNLFNKTINSLQSGDFFLIPNKTYSLTGGMYAENLTNVTFIIDGTISFNDDRDLWPKLDSGHVMESIYFNNLENVIFTSNGKGTFNGNGQKWWGSINFLKYQEDRPRLIHMENTKNILVENLLFKDSAFWTFYAEKSDGLLIRYTDVDARWTNLPGHSYIDLQAFNTDGFDVTGKNVYIHDCYIWNQDDCISVKDGSEDMLFERITCSGLGLVIGSIGSSLNNNITFRDCYLPQTVKGIYMKTRWSNNAPIGEEASISNILYENIVMDQPQQYSIWIGPAQQTGQPCELSWPLTKHSECIMSGYQTWTNITLRNITINNPEQSPGVLMGNSTNPIHNLIFEDIIVNNPGSEPWGSNYYCTEGGIEGYSSGSTTPIPDCFAQK